MTRRTCIVCGRVTMQRTGRWFGPRGGAKFHCAACLAGRRMSASEARELLRQAAELLARDEPTLAQRLALIPLAGVSDAAPRSRG